MKKVPRKYDSSLRKELAARTREQILDSARSLFAEQGYGRTSIEQIARSAGVAAPTIYSTYGSKRAILLQLLDEMEKAADASALQPVFEDRTGDERKQLRAFIDFSVRFFTDDKGLVRMAELAGMGEPDIQTFWQTGEARRLDACRNLLAGWKKRGALRAELTEAKAVDILWTLSGPQLHSLLVRKRHWSPQRFGNWLYDLACEQLLRCPDSS